MNRLVLGSMLGEYKIVSEVSLDVGEGYIEPEIVLTNALLPESEVKIGKTTIVCYDEQLDKLLNVFIDREMSEDEKVETSRKFAMKFIRIDELSAEELLELKLVYPEWVTENSYIVDDIVRYKDILYKVVQAHISQVDWTPDIVPALFTKVEPVGVIPNWVQPTGAHDAYQIGDKVIFNTKTYESLINANTWSPTAYAAGWKLVV